LVAPVVKSGEDEWNVYLPRGDWLDLWSDRRYQGPAEVKAAAPLDRIPVFVHGGAIVPTQQVVQYVDESSINPLTLDIYPDGSSARDYYEDDGISFDYQHGVWLRQRISVAPQADGMTIAISAREGSYKPPARAWLLKLHNQRNQPRRVEVNSQDLELQSTAEAFELTAQAWAYDEVRNIVEIKTPDQGEPITVRVVK